MPPHNAQHRRQPQPLARGLGRIEGVEDARQCLLFHAAAVITHLKSDDLPIQRLRPGNALLERLLQLAICQISAHHHAARLAPNSFRRVQDQIHDYLLHLRRIALNQRQVLGKLRRQPHVLRNSRLKEMNILLNQPVKVNWHNLKITAP